MDFNNLNFNQNDTRSWIILLVVIIAIVCLCYLCFQSINRPRPAVVVAPVPQNGQYNQSYNNGTYAY